MSVLLVQILRDNNPFMSAEKPVKFHQNLTDDPFWQNDYISTSFGQDFVLGETLP
jgi:hypothetical protein